MSVVHSGRKRKSEWGTETGTKKGREGAEGGCGLLRLRLFMTIG